MVEENKALAGKLDGDLQSAHRQMALIRAELSDTNKRISQLSSSGSSNNPTTGPNNHETSGPSNSIPTPASTMASNNGTNSNASTVVTTSALTATSTGGGSNNPTTNGVVEDRNPPQLNGVISNNGHGKTLCSKSMDK